MRRTTEKHADDRTRRLETNRDEPRNPLPVCDDTRKKVTAA